MASRSKSAVAAFTAVVAVLSCILEPPGYAISGRISGAQAHQVTVSLSGAALGADRTTRTDSSGAYSFDGVPKGVYTITPSLAGYHFNPASAPATVNDRDVAAMNFDGQLDDNQPADPLALQVYGRDMGSLYQNLSVVQQGVRVNDAVVKVNGQTGTSPSPGRARPSPTASRSTRSGPAGATAARPNVSPLQARLERSPSPPNPCLWEWPSRFPSSHTTTARSAATTRPGPTTRA